MNYELTVVRSPEGVIGRFGHQISALRSDMRVSSLKKNSGDLPSVQISIDNIFFIERFLGWVTPNTTSFYVSPLLVFFELLETARRLCGFFRRASIDWRFEREVSSQTLIFPKRDASISAVFPLLFVAFTSAPCSRRRDTVDELSPREALIRHVSPFRSLPRRKIDLSGDVFR